MTSAVLLWLTLLALAVTCFAAIGVQVLREFSRSQLRELLRSRNLLARYDEIVADHAKAALGAASWCVVAGAAAVTAATAYVWQAAAAEPAGAQGVLIAADIIVRALLLWLAVIWLPVAVARLWAAPFLALTWPLWKIVGKLAFPSLLGAQAVQLLLGFISGKRPTPHTEEDLEDEIREVVTEGQREGLLEEDAREMIESVITLGEVQVSEIMTPRTDMVSLPVDLPWKEALQLVISSGHTRFPVYGKNRDEIIGILHIKEMLHELVHGLRTAHRPIAELVRPPFFVPETKKVDELLQEFQKGRNHIAVVVDEFGGVSGLVTIEDVLEEIVGEIADEHDDAASDGIKVLNEHACETLARVHLSDINRRMSLHLPEDEHFDTIGGFVFHQLGRIPHAGEEIIHDGVKIKVLEATRRRINRVAIEVLPAAEQPAEQNGSESGVSSAE